jgi:hypothetical protein
VTILAGKPRRRRLYGSRRREMKSRSVRDLEDLLSEIVGVLQDELAALRIWQSANNSRSALALQNDIWNGMTISIDKIETMLRKCRNLGATPLSRRNKHEKQYRK